ncbi:NfeD family protein [Bacillus kwashiorkori]|uniref:NfeD family protein n=1 Tax=Bacillus kwashiorkori TaxID=1522318 RepID=UPI000B45147B|nr:NfeD family protein [Bacillus kwashiorkori]
MELFGVPIQTVYLWVLIIAGAFTLLYILFGDLLDGVFEALPFFNPALIFVFLVFLSATGYILELATSLSSILILIIATVGALILTILLNIFVFVPLKSAEESLVYREDSLKGRVGKVIIPIPKDGFGEVIIDSNSGRIAKSATGFDNEEIKEGIDVLIIDVKNGVLYVRPYDEKSIFSY